MIFMLYFTYIYFIKFYNEKIFLNTILINQIQKYMYYSKVSQILYSN